MVDVTVETKKQLWYDGRTKYQIQYSVREGKPSKNTLKVSRDIVRDTERGTCRKIRVPSRTRTRHGLCHSGFDPPGTRFFFAGIQLYGIDSVCCCIPTSVLRLLNS